MKKIFSIVFLLNYPKFWNLFKKEESILTILYTSLNIVLGQAYACTNTLRSLTGMPPLKKRGTIILEHELSVIHEGCYRKEKELALLRSERKTLLEQLHKDLYEYNDLTELKTKEEMRTVSSEKQFIPKLEFEESTEESELKLAKDTVDRKYNSYVPFSCNPKELELINRIEKDIQKLTENRASIFQNQLKRSPIKQLDKVKKGSEAKEPKQKNILMYTSMFTIIFSSVAILLGLISEWIVVKNVAVNNLNYTKEEAWLFGGILLVVSFVVSRMVFNNIERLLRTIKKQWWVIGVMAFGFMLQLLLSGILSAYNIQHEIKSEELKSDRIQLAILQGELTDLDEDEEVEEIAELEQKIHVLKKDIGVRSFQLRNPPIWTTYIGYGVIGIASVLTLFFMISAKVLGEVYSLAYKLKRRIETNRKRIDQIEKSYATEAHALLTAYDMRHELIHHMSKKHVLETLIAQKNTLSTEEFYKAYNITNNSKNTKK